MCLFRCADWCASAPTGYFFDASALVRRYVSEVGSTWVKSQIAPDAQNAVFISDLTTVAVAAAEGFSTDNPTEHPR